MKQATILTCKVTFSFKVGGKGRNIIFKQGQLFWVVNSELDQQTTQIIHVARKGQKIGYNFPVHLVEQYFSIP